MKDRIKAFALQLGADDIGFAAITDYKSPQSPSPEAILPEARTMIVLAYAETATCASENVRVAMGGRMAVMELMHSNTHRLCRFIERDCNGKAVMITVSYPSTITPEAKFGLIADFSHRHAAVAAGLGNWGRHNLVIHPILGTRVLFTTILTDLELPADSPVTEELCNSCNLCVEACPGRALDEHGKTDPMKCLAYSQPYGMGGAIRFWSRFFGSSAEDRKKMLSSPEYMRLYQAGFIGYQYHCFRCYAVCPVCR